MISKRTQIVNLLLVLGALGVIGASISLLLELIDLPWYVHVTCAAVAGVVVIRVWSPLGLPHPCQYCMRPGSAIPVGLRALRPRRWYSRDSDFTWVCADHLDTYLSTHDIL